MDAKWEIESLRLEILVKNIVLKPCLLIILFEKWAQFPILARHLLGLLNWTNVKILNREPNLLYLSFAHNKMSQYFHNTNLKLIFVK